MKKSEASQQPDEEPKKLSASQWKQILSQGKGYIYNDYSKATGSGVNYNVLHEATCWTLKRALPTIDKYYFETMAEATSWLDARRPQIWRACGTCAPG